MKPQSAPSVILVGVDLGLPHFDAELEELGLLAQTAGLQPVARITCKRKAPDAALFVGSGKADEIRSLAQMHGAVEVLFDQALSPAAACGHEDIRPQGRPPTGGGSALARAFGRRGSLPQGEDAPCWKLQLCSAFHISISRSAVQMRGFLIPLASS